VLLDGGDLKNHYRVMPPDTENRGKYWPNGNLSRIDYEKNKKRNNHS
jgi:hypothetical protein